MTTIAYKDGVIAYDSQITRGDVITYDDYDKCLEQGGVKFFCCGAVPDYQRLVDVYFGAKPDGNIDATAIVLDGESLMMVAVDDAAGLWRSPILLDRPVCNWQRHALRLRCDGYGRVRREGCRDGGQA
ncbi:proteasome subunit beta [Pseudomonas sp. GD03858]|uniref:proteasome subunit beta n=1 Tax=unclassified Pseudomonas TaxID=196821 RepID=UPI003266A42F